MKKEDIFYQFSKFFLVGGMNVLIDLGILSLLIVLFKIDKGLWYSAFKGFSFLLAAVNSYFWNKLWTFAPQRRIRRGGGDPIQRVLNKIRFGGIMILNSLRV